MKLKVFCIATFAISFNFIAQVPNYIPTDNLFSWISFNGNFNDESINNFTLNNSGVTLSTDRFGNPNSAGYFNGSSNLEFNDSFDFNERTISLWVETSSFNNTIQLVLCNDYPDLNYGHSLISLQPNQTIRPQSGNVECINSPFQLNSWYSVIITRGLTTTNFYINGVLECSQFNSSLESNNTVSQNLILGCTRLYDRYFTGRIDDLGLWKRELTPCEIQDVYSAQLNSINSSISNNGVSLNSNQNNANYQWMNCYEMYTPINGEVNQAFNPSSNGFYAVEIELNGCVDTSDCTSFNFLDLEEENYELINVFPNPTDENVTITFNSPQIGEIELMNILGKSILVQDITSKSNEITLKNKIAPGNYLIRIYDQNKKVVFQKKLFYF